MWSFATQKSNGGLKVYKCPTPLFCHLRATTILTRTGRESKYFINAAMYVKCVDCRGLVGEVRCYIFFRIFKKEDYNVS